MWQYLRLYLVFESLQLRRSGSLDVERLHSHRAVPVRLVHCAETARSWPHTHTQICSNSRTSRHVDVFIVNNQFHVVYDGKSTDTRTNIPALDTDVFLGPALEAHAARHILLQSLPNRYAFMLSPTNHYSTVVMLSIIRLPVCVTSS